MNRQNKSIYEFGSFRLDLTQHILLRNGEIVALTPKVFETLRVLVEKSGQVVDKDELLKTIWSDTIVEEANLAKNISVLRKVLNENGSGGSCIETIPKRGYRFITPVKEISLKEIENLNAAPAATEKVERPLNVSSGKKIGVITAIISFAFLVVLTGSWWLSSKPSAAKSDTSLKSIAILPFKPLVTNDEDQSLGLGMADALIIKLGQLNKVNVRPTSHIRSYAWQERIDVVAAGKDLEVEAVLEGSIQRINDRIRITVQLTNIADGRQIWSDKFDEKATDFFVLQDAIAVRVANSLIPQLTASEKEKLFQHDTKNPEAFRRYVLGANWIDKETAEGFSKSIGYLEKAVELDPAFTSAYLMLSFAYSEASESHMRPGEAMPKARYYAETALRQNPNLEWAHYQVAWVKMLYDWDWRGAENSFKRALELNPDFSRAHFGYGTYFSLIGNREKALSELDIAKKLNPFGTHGSNILYRVREYDRAISASNEALEMNPQRISSLQWLAMSYEQKGLYEETLAAFDRARAVEDTPELRAFQAHTYALAGKKEEALKVITELKELSKGEQYVSPFYIAVIYAGLGDKDAAFMWLEKAYQDKSYWIATLKTYPQFDGLRDDARFQKFLKIIRQ